MKLSTQTHYMCQVFGPTEGIRLLAEAGYDALDLSMFHLNRDDAPELGNDWKRLADEQKAVAEACGVFFNQAHAPFGGGYNNYTERLIPRLPRIFEYCARIGARTVTVHPIQKGRYAGHEEELFELNMAFYHSLLPYAKACGVKIAIENLWQRNPKNGMITDDVCADPRELARYADTLNDESFTVCLDLGHIGLCGREPDDAIRTLGGRIGALHVHDVDYKEDLHTLPGYGKYDWDLICGALGEIGYSGEFTYEADRFLHGLPKSSLLTGARLMVEVGRSLIAKIEACSQPPAAKSN